LLVNQYYWPDHASTGQHLTDLAESLVDQGHEVHVLCSRRGSRPGSPTRPGLEQHNGVVIHRVGASSFGRGSTVRRMADYLSFHVGALVRALSLPRPDVVVTLTTPPLIAIIGLMLRLLRGSSHVYWSMDLHPDASVALGRMSHRRASVRLLQWLSDAFYRHADRVVTLGPYMTDRIRDKGVPHDRIVAIPVWSRRDEVFPLPRDGHPLRAELGLTGKFVVMYSGNHGLAHRFEEFIEAARRLRHREDIVFLFVGDGPRQIEVRTALEAFGLENIRLLDFFPREQLHASLSVADAHLVSLRPEMTGICVPGKLYGAMASARPVLFVGPGHCEVADTIRQADCGHAFLSGEGAALAQTIADLADDPWHARVLGERGLAAFSAEYDREACCAQWCWMIDELQGLPRPSRAPASAPAPVARGALFAPQFTSLGSSRT
jgi:glycosyltransferase involved in cell wall biosynthesis